MKATFVITMTLFAFVSFVASAESKDRPRKATAERIAKMGGYVGRPGSLQGSIAIIDTQKKVNVEASLTNVLNNLKRKFPIRVDLIREEADEPIKLKNKVKANFAIILTNNENAPSLALYPEDDYAVVNFARFTNCLKLPEDSVIFESRCAKGVLKALILLTNGGGSQFSGHVAMARKPEQLDLASDVIPIDIQDSMKRYLESAGVTPMRRTLYRKACQEGWAPAPTNDIQKAIWNEVHAIPQKPLKIEFDPKTDTK